MTVLRCSSCDRPTTLGAPGETCTMCGDGVFETMPDGVPFFACRPVTLDMNDELECELAVLPLYDDAIKIECDLCRRTCWLSPNQKVVRDDIGGVALCARCVITSGWFTPSSIIPLGNTEGRSS